MPKPAERVKQQVTFWEKQKPADPTKKATFVQKIAHGLFGVTVTVTSEWRRLKKDYQLSKGKK
jgi:hypothetical protein